MRAIAAVVTGAVQGVGFRFTTQRMAQRLGLVGWVRNEPDGSVAVRAQGPSDAIDAFASYLAQGPQGARVTSVELDDVAPDPSLVSFEIRW